MSKTTFKVQDYHINAVGRILANYPEVWIHGDGNLYITEERSNFRKNYSSPETGECEYVLHFKKGDQIPATVEDMMKAFYAAKQNENMQSMVQKQESTVTGFSMSDEKKSKKSEK